MQRERPGTPRTRNEPERPDLAARLGMTVPAVPGGQGAPFAAEALVAVAHELRALLDELAEEAEPAACWGFQPLRENVELALAWPQTLADADNQCDFVEELAEAVWAGPGGGGFHGQCGPAPTCEEMLSGEQRRAAISARLDQITTGLCLAVEEWTRFVARPRGPEQTPGFPQAGHSV